MALWGFPIATGIPFPTKKVVRWVRTGGWVRVVVVWVPRKGPHNKAEQRRSTWLVIWAQASMSGPKVTMSAEVPKKRQTILGRVSSVFTSIFGSKAEEAPPSFDISTPYNFKHVQHVKADPHSSTGFSVSDVFLA